MPKQDPVPLPYGSLQYYQVHYILKRDSKENDSFLARCEPITKGHFSGKRVISVRWTGSEDFSRILQQDSKLTEMLKEVMLHEGEIRVDPMEDHIRIYGKWIHEDTFAFSQAMLEIADRIASHIKGSLRDMGELP
ncbi:MAG TPA: hypothetical protein VD736_02345 [Nitrososphaera sp.]|nr:hypothetical protein [Nitrososphaera sp.]